MREWSCPSRGALGSSTVSAGPPASQAELWGLPREARNSSRSSVIAALLTKLRQAGLVYMSTSQRNGIKGDAQRMLSVFTTLEAWRTEFVKEAFIPDKHALSSPTAEAALPGGPRSRQGLWAPSQCGPSPLTPVHWLQDREEESKANLP